MSCSRECAVMHIIHETFDEIDHPYPLEDIDKFLVSEKIVDVIDKFLDGKENRFKIEIITMPDWTFKGNYFKIGEDLYTHVKFKKGFDCCG